jgi:hypothetical protein
MSSNLLLLIAVFALSVSASFETSCSNNNFYPLHSGLQDPWAFVARPPAKPYNYTYVADWTFHPPSLTINLHLSVLGGTIFADADFVLGLSTRNGSLLFNTSLSALLSGASLLGNAFDKTWFLGQLQPDRSIWALHAIHSATGQPLELIMPVAVPDQKPVVCFHSELLYIISDSTISQYYYNRTTQRMINTWTRRSMPKCALDFTTCNVIGNGDPYRGALVYYSEGVDRVKSVNVVTMGGRLLWGPKAPNRLSYFRGAVWRPAVTYFNVSLFLAGANSGSYYSVDIETGRASEILIKTNASTKAQQQHSGLQSEFTRSGPFVISEHDFAVAVDVSPITGQKSLFAMKEGKLKWQVPVVDDSSNSYQVIIDNIHQQVFLMKIALSDDGAKGMVYNLADGSFVRFLPPQYSGQNSTVFRDASFSLQYQKLDNGLLAPRVVGYRRDV